MSAITTNPFATGFAAGTAPDFERPTGNAFADAMIPSVRERSDAIFKLPITPLPIAGFGGGGDSGAGAGASTGSFASVMNLVFSAISSLFANLGSMFSSLPPQPTSGQQYFADASSSSLGDPHLAFDGTTGSGANVAGHWNSMTSHANLLASDSFAGGYRISTGVSQPNAAGVTVNDRVDVATDGGRTDVSMRADGSYDVVADGRDVTLQAGRAVSLGDGETVTLGTNGSLTIADENANGGTLRTTIAKNGAGGLDVTATAHDVDLGGFLVDRSDADADPLAQTGGGFDNTIVPIYAGPTSFSNVPFDAEPFASRPFDATASLP